MEKKIFRFQMPSTILVGENSLKSLGQEAKRFGHKALIVGDVMMEKLGNVKHVQDFLEQESIECVSFTDIQGEPTDKNVEAALKVCRAFGAQVIVAVGGGSSLDVAKAVSVVATNPGYIGEFQNSKRLASVPGLPVIAVPTSAGTGSEATDVTVISDTQSDVKMMIKQPAFLPSVAIIDAELSRTAPKMVKASSGLDALCHALESFVSIRRNEWTKTYSIQAFTKIMHFIKRAWDDADDLEANNMMALAALEAGIAFSNASVTLIHGMSRPLGIEFHIPHGLSNAMLLPMFLKYQFEDIKPELAQLARLTYPSDNYKTDAEAAENMQEKILALVDSLEVTTLKEFGVTEDSLIASLDKMAVDALDSGSPQNNRKVADRETIKRLYLVAYGLSDQRIEEILGN